LGYSNKEDTYWSAVSLAANYDGDAIETRNIDLGLMTLVWEGATATDAVIKLQRSLDKTTWFDIASQTKTIGAASGSFEYELTPANLSSGWIRALLTKNTETTGTATLKYLLKGDR
jgi:hypothetical protein